MADQAAPAPQAAPATQPAAPSDGKSKYDVHGCAMKAQTALEKLATELAHDGAPKNVTGTVTKMADAVRQIVTYTAGQASPAPAAPAQAEQPHTMSSAANSLVADVAARKAQGG